MLSIKVCLSVTERSFQVFDEKGDYAPSEPTKAQGLDGGGNRVAIDLEVRLLIHHH